MRNQYKPLMVVFTAMMTSSCAVGPNFERPSLPTTSSYRQPALLESLDLTGSPGTAEQHFSAGSRAQGQWWKLFNSPVLNSMVEEAVTNNPDLQAAKAALRSASEAADSQRADFLPHIDATINSSRQRIPGPLAGPLVDSDVNLYTFHTAQLSVGYVPDVFGGNRRKAESLASSLEAQKFEGEAIYMTLVSNVVSTAIEVASLRQQVDKTRAVLELQRGLLTATASMKRLGQVGGMDVVTKQLELAQLEAAVPALNMQLTEKENRLAVLMGRPPTGRGSEDFNLSSLCLPAELPLSVPSQLVEDRPDVRAAESRLHAASADIGIAAAARFPTITLGATIGSSALEVLQLFRSGSGSWSLGGDLLQPIFHGGALKHQQRSAEAAFEQASAQYRSVVLTAFEDTANTLQSVVTNSQELRAASSAKTAAHANLEMVRRARELGGASMPELLTAKQAYEQADLAVLQAETTRYTNTVALHLTLGGWWQEKAVGPEKSTATVQVSARQ